MVDETPPTESIKEAFLRILKRESIELMEHVLTSKAIGVALIFWLLISAGVSIFRRSTDRCDKLVPLDTYFYAKALCPIEKTQ
ncbi:MAG: hypothetical protein ACHQYQ_09435 [Bacteriovoracales bacterium]